nr:DUF3592 domain-containing protein [uncultured Marinifilum sp.]
MKVSGLRFTIITILILLIPIYANWKLLINGEKTEGIVIKTSKEDTGQFYSFYSIIRYKVEDKYHRLKGPENIEYPKGKTFTILYYPKNPENAIIYNIKGICLNKFTAVSIILFILWMAFYLSFSPKSEKRKSKKEFFKPSRYLNNKKLR